MTMTYSWLKSEEVGGTAHLWDSGNLYRPLSAPSVNSLSGIIFYPDELFRQVLMVIRVKKGRVPE